MNAIQIAEKALEKAKQEEKLKYRLRELDELVKSFQGKCFGSHTFDRQHAASNMSAVYYEKFYLEKDEIFVVEHILRLCHMDSFHKKSMKQIQYNRNIYTKQLTGQNEYNASYNLDSGYSGFRKEISINKFKQLWEAGEEANVIIKNVFNGKVPELKMEWITQADFGYEAKIDKCIKDMGIEMIDFKDFPIVHSVLEYRTLPMFDRRRYLPKLYAKSILKWHIIQLEEDCKSVFTTAKSYEHVQKQIKIIQEFINKYL